MARLTTAPEGETRGDDCQFSRKNVFALRNKQHPDSPSFAPRVAPGPATRVLQTSTCKPLATCTSPTENTLDTGAKHDAEAGERPISHSVINSGQLARPGFSAPPHGFCAPQRMRYISTQILNFGVSKRRSDHPKAPLSAPKSQSKPPEILSNSARYSEPTQPLKTTAFASTPQVSPPPPDH